jgi:hypothetical protein
MKKWANDLDRAFVQIGNNNDKKPHEEMLSNAVTLKKQRSIWEGDWEVVKR